MPSFTFKGFATGSPVALSAAQGALSDSGSVPAWGASLSISTFTAGTITAPAGVWFEITNASGFNASGPALGEVYDPQFHEITYIWDFGDAGSFSTALNLPASWNNRNVAYGPRVCHTFDTPGTYTVSVWAIDSSGTKGYAETTVTVVDAGAVYAGSDTIVVSNDAAETWAGAPAGAVQITSIAALNAAIAGLAAPARILFKRGQAWDNVRVELLNFPVEYIGTWGAGARPVLRADDSTMVTFTAMFRHAWTTNSLSQFTAAGLDLRGGWDPTTETGKAHSTPFFFQFSQTACHYTVHDVNIDGFNSLYMGTHDGFDCVTICNEVTVTNWRDYAVYHEVSQTQREGWTGSVIAQNVNALNGGSGGFSHPMSNNEGGFRWPFTKNVYLGVVDVFSRSGWSPLESDHADQPPFRINTAGFEGMFLVADRVAAEGGFRGTISLQPANASDADSPGNYLFDKILVVGNGKSIGPLINSHYGGATWRNVYAVHPDVPPWHTGNPFQYLWDFSPEGAVAPNNAGETVSFYNSTGLYLPNTANDLGFFAGLYTGDASFTDFTAENNLIHAPAADTPITVDAPVDTTTALVGFTPRYGGVEYNFPTISGAFGDVANGGTFTVSYPSGTDQAYWLTVTSTNHTLYVGNDLLYFTANDGELAVTFGAADITIGNLSGMTWAGGNYTLRLDRSSKLVGLNSLYASPATIPLPRPQTGSSAVDGGDIGRKAYDDFFGTVRPGPGGTDHLGNARAAGGSERGAFLTG